MKDKPLITTQVSGVATHHDKQNGIVYFNLDAGEGVRDRCADDGVIQPFDSLLQNDTKVSITYKGGKVIKIAPI